MCVVSSHASNGTCVVLKPNGIWRGWVFFQISVGVASYHWINCLLPVVFFIYNGGSEDGIVTNGSCVWVEVQSLCWAQSQVQKPANYALDIYLSSVHQTIIWKPILSALMCLLAWAVSLMSKSLVFLSQCLEQCLHYDAQCALPMWWFCFGLAS